MKKILAWFMVAVVFITVMTYPARPSVTFTNTMNFFLTLEPIPSIITAKTVSETVTAFKIARISADIVSFAPRFLWWGVKVIYSVQKYFLSTVINPSGELEEYTKPPLLTDLGGEGWAGGR